MSLSLLPAMGAGLLVAAAGAVGLVAASSGDLTTLETLRGAPARALAVGALAVGGSLFVFRPQRRRDLASVVLLGASGSALAVFLIQFSWFGGSF